MRTSWSHLRLPLVACLVWAAASWTGAVRASEPPAPAGGLSATGAEEQQDLAESPTVSPADEPQSAETGSYRIRPGDTVSVTVLGEPAYSGSFTVRPDGTILFQDDMVGTVPVGGCTTLEAMDVVADRIGQFVKDPTVILAIGRFNVMVTGEVRQPGQYELASGARLMEAVQKAGGAKDEERDLERVYLTRASGEELRFSLRDFKEDGDESQNPLLGPGDRVSVARSASSESGEFKVTGAVAKPGTFRLREDEETRISDAVEDAGRWTEDANPRSARLMREDGTSVTTDLTRMDEDPSSTANVALHDGDELFVPRNATRVSVLGGGVKSPGEYLVASGTTLLEVLSTAGGLEERAILRDCAVVRSEPKPVRIPANLERLIKQGDMSQNPVLQDRDVVFVPVREAPSGGGGKSAFQSITDSAWRYIMLFRYF